MRFLIGWMVFFGLFGSSFCFATQESLLKQWQEPILKELQKSLPKKPGQNITLPPSIQFAVKRIFAPVFKSRGQFAAYKLTGAKINDDFKLVIEIATLSYFKGTTDKEWVEGSYRAGSQYLMGNYRIVLHNDELKIPGIPNLVRVVKDKNNTEHGDNTKDNRVEGELHLTFPFNDIESLSNTQIQLMQNRLRSLVRADAILHPHSNLDEHVKSGAPMVPSDPQQETIDALVKFSREYREKADFSEPLKMGMIMPVGMGKSFTSARLIATLHALKELPNSPRIVIALENTLMLDTLARTFANQFNLPAKKIRKIYGDHLKTIWEQNFSDAKLILVSRSSYYTHMEKIHDLVKKDKKSSWAFVFDEAHHLGKADGQFESIFDGRDDIQGLNEILSSKDVVLLMSATLWREDANLVTRLLKGRVFGPFLNPQELSQLQRGEDLEKLCQKQFFRATSAGYLSPIYGLRVHHTVGGLPIHKLLNDTQKVESVEDLQSQLTIHMAIVQHLRQEILKNRIKGVFDHGVIFVPTIYHANLYAGLLNEAFGAQTLFRPYHSGKGVNRDEVEDWFIYNKKIQSHKYLLVVDILKEAIDIPGINLEVFLVNMLRLKTKMQSLGRGSRLDQGKTDLRVLDYSGSMVDILSDDLGRESLVEEIPINLLSRPLSSNRAPPLLSVDDKTVSVDQIKQESIEVLSKGMELADEVNGIEGDDAVAVEDQENVVTEYEEGSNDIKTDLDPNSNVISKTDLDSSTLFNFNGLIDLALSFLSLVKEKQYLLIEAKLLEVFKEKGISGIPQDLKVLFKGEKVNVYQRLKEIENSQSQHLELYTISKNYTDKDIVAFERIMWDAQQAEFIFSKEILFPYMIALQIDRDKKRVLEVVIVKVLERIERDLKKGRNRLEWYNFLSKAFNGIQSIPKKISQNFLNQLLQLITTPANSYYGLCDGTTDFFTLYWQPSPINGIQNTVGPDQNVAPIIEQLCGATVQYYAKVGDLKRDLINYVLTPSWKSMEFRDKIRLADYLVYELNHLNVFDLKMETRSRKEKQILQRSLLQYLVTLMQQLLSGSKSESEYLANYIKKSFFEKLEFGNINELVQDYTNILLDISSLSEHFSKEWFEESFPTLDNVIHNDQIFDKLLKKGIPDTLIEHIIQSTNRLYKWLRLAQIEKAQGLSEEQKSLMKIKLSEHSPDYQLHIAKFIRSKNMQTDLDFEKNSAQALKNDIWNELRKFLRKGDKDIALKLQFGWHKEQYYKAFDDRGHVAMKILRLYLRFKKDTPPYQLSPKEELLLESTEKYSDNKLEEKLDTLKSFRLESYLSIQKLFQEAAVVFFETQNQLDIDRWFIHTTTEGKDQLVFTKEFFKDYWQSVSISLRTEEASKTRWMEHLFYFLNGFQNKENFSHLEEATIEYLIPFANELTFSFDPSSSELTPLIKWSYLFDDTSTESNDKTAFFTYLLTHTFKLALERKLTTDRLNLITNLYKAVLKQPKYNRSRDHSFIHSWFGFKTDFLILDEQSQLVQKFLDLIVHSFKNEDHQVNALIKDFLPGMSEHVLVNKDNLIYFVTQLFSIEEATEFLDETLLEQSLNFVLNNFPNSMGKVAGTELYKLIIQNVSRANGLNNAHPLIFKFIVRSFARIKDTSIDEVDNLDDPILLKFYLKYLASIPPYARDRNHFRVRNLFLDKINDSMRKKRKLDYDVAFFKTEMDWLIDYNYKRLGEDPAEITKGNVFKSSEEYWKKWSEVFERWSQFYPEKASELKSKKDLALATQTKLLNDEYASSFLKLPRNLQDVYNKIKKCDESLN
ncbi:MAG: DEAD/DEAH box helicase family protein [Bdellovibrionales bacterium]|nr:DEAD/DEAH box helicase family protein [Bdellovibrionales bacterium]